MKFRKVDRGSKLFLKVDSDFEKVNPNNLSHAIWFEDVAESLSPVGDPQSYRRAVS
jgi:hypothetical protein